MTKERPDIVAEVAPAKADYRNQISTHTMPRNINLHTQTNSAHHEGLSRKRG